MDGKPSDAERNKWLDDNVARTRSDIAQLVGVVLLEVDAFIRVAFGMSCV